MSPTGRHSGEGRVRQMLATMKGRCPLCNGLIEPGEEIKQWAYRRWGHPDCVDYAHSRRS